jgi:hypothetical protein
LILEQPGAGPGEQPGAGLTIPGIDSTYDLEKGLVYVFTEDKLLYGTYVSSVDPAKALNPGKVKPRGRQIKISRLMGLEGLVTNELGSFYFTEHPDNDRVSLTRQGSSPVVFTTSS